MQAAVYTERESITVLEYPSVDPKAGEVKVRVAYTGICGTDVHIFHGKMDTRIEAARADQAGESSTPAPLPIGHEMSGVIEEIGSGVTGYAVGDHVTVCPLDYTDDGSDWKGEGRHIRPGLKFMGIDTPGSFQHSWTVPAQTLHKLPKDLPLDIAALSEPLAVACHDIRLGKVQAGEQVVVLGGGPIGMLIAMVAQAEGAKVLVSEINTYRLALLKEMGIDSINPLEEDLEAEVLQRTNGAGVQVVFEVTGTQAGCDIMPKLLAVRGRIVVVGIFADPPKIDLFQFFWKELQLCGARVYESEDFEKAIALAAEGSMPLEKLISRKVGLTKLQETFEAITNGENIIKVLVACS